MKFLTSFFLAAFSFAVLADDKAEAKFPANFKGKLIELKDGKVVDVELEGEPEFYVLYHSASW